MTAQSPARLASPPAVRGQLPLTPGRWFALFIGVPVLLAIIGFAGLNFVALAGQASFTVRDTIPVHNGQVTARVNSGDIMLRQAASGGGSAAEFTGTAHYSLFRPTVRISGSTVTFPCGFVVGSCSLSATLQVPARTAVSLFTYGGDATIPSFAGSPLTVNTDGGNLTAASLAGNLDLSTGGGDLTVGKLEGPVSVRTDGGNLGIQAMEAANPTVSSGGGDVFLVFRTAPHNLQIRSDGGNVTVVLPHGKYRVSTNADGGNVNNAVGSQSGATNVITVDSGGGDINIRAAS
jgi:Putative adhesin